MTVTPDSTMTPAAADDTSTPTEVPAPDTQHPAGSAGPSAEEVA